MASFKKKSAPLSGSGKLPLLPLKDVVVFPRMVVPLMVGRPSSLAAVEESLASERPLFLCAQKDPEVESPGKGDIYKIGVFANILQTLRMPDGTMKIVVEGLGRGTVQQYYETESHDEVRIKEKVESSKPDEDIEALMRLVLRQFEDYARLGQRVAAEVALSFRDIKEEGPLADMVCAHLTLRIEERQELLEMVSPKERLERVSGILIRENELYEIERTVRERVRDQMERGQRDFYLNEQLKVIQQELGQREDGGDEWGELRAMIKKAKMPKEAHEKAMRELGRYERMPPMSPEGAVVRTYIEWLSEMPWKKRTRDNIDIDNAIVVLDEDHYGLNKVKERILEFLAVRTLSATTRGPVLCLVGPPGVGKTSLGRSIARAMGRKFIRVSLGGIRDEAEIRGHRRTYIGALPGRIVQSIKKCGVKNPVFMLDEIDKMSVDFRGDPSSALLEALDPEQNRHFSDHYLEVDYDLHEVFFITTANSEYDIPEPLLDRMEVVRISGYTTHEKERIAEQFLIPKQLTESGLTDVHICFQKKGLDTIITRYTHEAGVRELERQIASICRKVARKVVSKGKLHKKMSVTDTQAFKMLGPPIYSDLKADRKAYAGLAIGLAWTVAGGDILNVETTTMRGKGGLQLTGQLGEVMQESAQAAYTYLRSHGRELGVRTDFWKTSDLHVHVPEGAIPKDGPSAGVSIAVSMLSALLKRAPKARLAMTGEITLQGRVLAVGGIKEKILTAHRAGIETVLVPRENEKDLTEVPKEVLKELKCLFVDKVEDVFRLSFARPPKPVKKRR